MLCRNLWTSGKLIDRSLNRRLWHVIDANMHNLKSVKRAPVLNNKFALFVTSRRTFFGMFKRPSKTQMKIKDNVPDQYVLIYRNTMDRYILYTQLITTAAAFTFILTMIIKYDFVKNELPISTSPKADENDIYIFMTAFISLIVILQLMIYRIPIRIYYLSQQKRYIFVFYGNYPLTQRQLSCQIGDVVHLPETGISPWRQGRYMIKDNQKVIMLEQHFRRPADLYVMLGVQRDPDVDEKK